MESKSFDALPWILAGGIALVAILCAVDASRGTSEIWKIRAEAVEKGYAEYYTGKDNTPKWRWKRTESEKKHK